MTLFHRAAPDEPVFVRVLDRFWAGAADPATERLLAEAEAHAEAAADRRPGSRDG